MPEIQWGRLNKLFIRNTPSIKAVILYYEVFADDNICWLRLVMSMVLLSTLLTILKSMSNFVPHIVNWVLCIWKAKYNNKWATKVFFFVLITGTSNLGLSFYYPSLSSHAGSRYLQSFFSFCVWLFLFIYFFK